MPSFAQQLRQKAWDLRYQPSHRHYGWAFNYFRWATNGSAKTDFQDFIGCSETEIEELKHAQGVTRLPSIFLDYLRHFGKQSGDLFIAHKADFHDLRYLKQSGIRLAKFISKNIPNYHLPADSFVLWGDQQDVAYCYFLTDNPHNDPPVYLVSEALIDDPEALEDLPYRDENGIGWSSISAYLTLFIKSRAGEEAYRQFLRQFTLL